VRSVIAVCRRLHRRSKAKAVAVNIAIVDRQISQLRDDMAIDDRLASMMRKLYEKSPTLQQRRIEDRVELERLQLRRDALARRRISLLCA
jgi:hypothetical protein